MSQTKVKSGLLNFPDQTDFVKLPSGTTAQRPSSPEKGYSRYNTTDNKLEFWNGTIWQQLPGVVAPIITSISYPGDDLAADPAGGQTITINGTDFKAGATVTVDGTTPSVITFVSATEITFSAPAKIAGDYDIVVTNLDGGNATAVDGMTYNGLPSWTTPAGNLGTFVAGSTIPTITLVATEPDSGVVSYSVTTGALPTGLTLTGADIDGTVPSPAGQTTYNFSVTASDDENQSTERAFNIVVYLQVTNTVDNYDPFGDSSGVALYRFENNANDEGGVYNGTPSNVTYATGVFGQAGVFNGSTSSYIYRNPDFLPYGNSPRAFSFWVKLDSHVEDAYFLSYGDGVSGQFFSPRITPTSQGGYISFMGFAVDYSTNVVMTTNEWMNLCYSYDGSVMSIYKNGALIGSSSLSLNTTNVRDFIVGARDYNGSITKPIDGSMDQLRVFNRALTPLEVESLYRERTVLCGGQADTLDILGDNSCIATYQLNGNANDLSGNYSGTPTDVSYGVGEFDLAGVFNGSSSFINLGQQNQFANSQVSFSVWINPSVFTNGSRVILASTNGGSFAEDDFALYFRDNNTSGFIGTEVGQSSSIYEAKYTTTTGIPINSWSHIVLTFDTSLGTNITSVFINGVSQSLTNTYAPGGTFSGSILDSTLNLNIGKRNISGSELYFNGSIDQVRIFNKALNSTEVATLYNETACDALACGGTTNTLDILSDGSCIAAYPLDGSPADLSGNYNGVQTDVTYPVGNFDLAGSFNGGSSYIDTSYTLPAISAYSVSAWINKTTTGVRQAIFSDYNSLGEGNTVRASIYISDLSKFEFVLGDGTNVWVDQTSIDASPYIDGNWHNLVLIINGTSVKLYANGTEIADLTSSVSAGTAGTQSIKIGRAGDLNNRYWNGLIDQVRIFNKALSAGEVTTLYNETACN